MTSQTPLWDWACAAWARPAVEKECLRAQDDYGLDVNVVLWCAWLAHKAQTPGGDGMDAALAASACWRSVLEPLRQARDALASDSELRDADTLRQAVLNAELAAEKRELALLEKISGESAEAHESPAEALKAALRLYSRRAGIEKTFDPTAIVNALTP